MLPPDAEDEGAIGCVNALNILVLGKWSEQTGQFRDERFSLQASSTKQETSAKERGGKGITSWTWGWMQRSAYLVVLPPTGCDDLT